MAVLNKQAFDPTGGLNEIKVYMAYLEQYKKVSKDDRVGYYDRYKNVIDTSNIDLVKHKKILTCYWEEMADQAEKGLRQQVPPFVGVGSSGEQITEG